MKTPDIRIDGDGRDTIVLAHGAGNPMDSDFLEVFARGLAGAGFRVARFEFPYMARRRTEGVQAGPDPLPVLLDAWRQVVAELGGGEGLVIGGKSMGGRMASMVADEVRARGLVCLGYPFHPAGRPERTRVEHLAGLRTPTLIVQGERDAFGTPADVATYSLSPSIAVRWIPAGDHSFTPTAASGCTRDGNRVDAIAAVAAFARERFARNDGGVTGGRGPEGR